MIIVGDEAGSVIGQFDEKKRLEDPYKKNGWYGIYRGYDAFGNLVWYNQQVEMKGNMGYQGKFYDWETGLYYYYHRYYDPKIGRFITEDPIGLEGGMNFCRFVLNNPLNMKDYFGDYPSIGCITANLELMRECSFSFLKNFGEEAAQNRKDSERYQFEEGEWLENYNKRKACPFISNTQVKKQKSTIKCAVMTAKTGMICLFGELTKLAAGGVRK